MSSTLSSRLRRPGSDPEPRPDEAPGRARRLWSALPVCAGFAVFGVIIWLAYQDASLGPPIGEPPLIKAEPEPIKLPPEQAQEPTLAAEQGVIGRLWSDAGQADQPERLLPPPEEPLSPPIVEQPAITQQAPEQPAGQRANEPAAESAAGEAAGGESDAGVAALPSDTPAGAPDSASLQAATDASQQEAEAALDRLLAEVTALSDPDAPDSPNSPASTGSPASAGAASSAGESTVEPPPDRAESPAREPATTPARGADRAAPAAPPAKPAAEAPTTTAETSPEVRPAGAITGAPASDGQAPDRPTQTAALSGAGARIAPPPVAPDGQFRIQLAAVRGEADARRAWNLFMADLEPVLSEVEPIFERAETVNGVFYRVQIGPFASQQSAESLCEQLKQRNASCFVIRR